LSISGFNTGLIKSEISNLANAKKEQEGGLISLEKGLSDLKRQRAGLLDNYNVLLSQLENPGLPDNFRINVEEKLSEIKQAIKVTEYQMSSVEKKIEQIKHSRENISDLILSRKTLLSNLAGRMAMNNLAQNSLQTNKELGRLKG